MRSCLSAVACKSEGGGEIGMRNINHDLIHQLSEALDSIWRFELYQKESKACNHCQELWKKLTEKYKEIETLLLEEISRHVKEGVFN